MSDVPLIVSAEWLQERIAAGAQGLVLLDATWFPRIPGVVGPTGREAYESLHIPGALHFDLDACVTKTQYIPRNLPEPVSFEKYMRTLGICPESHVIVYDRDDGNKILKAAAPRATFVLKAYGHDRVSLLNGGLVNWTNTGRQTESGPPPPRKTGTFTVSLRKDLLVDFEDMKRILDSDDHHIIDTRLPGHFNGELDEPADRTKIALEDAGLPLPGKDEMTKGHMTRAINIPYTTPYSDFIFYGSLDELNKMFLKAGITKNKPIVTTCYIGHTAATMAILALWCGYSNVKLYYGSWTEYGQKTAKGN